MDNIETMMQQILAQLKAHQEKVEAYQERRKKEKPGWNGWTQKRKPFELK
jgi:uncharacterized protein YbcC (UPF0753/DUF2309 family)